MQWLDRVSAAMLARTPPQRQVFRDGWGDPDVLDWYASIVREPPEIPEVALRAGARHRLDGLVATDLTFDTPALHLPAAAHPGRARVIEPPDGAERACVLMAAWNEHGYDARTRLARLLAPHGIASVILENPHYGARRADPGDDRPLATVADFAVMGRAAVVEGLTVLAAVRREGRTPGVAGFSMGGNMAAFVGAMAPFPTAISPAAGSHSPAPPFLQGVIRTAIAWDALGGDDPDTRERLRGFFRSASVLDHDPPPHTAAAVMVAGTIDGFVPTSAVLALHRHWPGSKMEWVNAGHATLLWRNKDRMADGIVQSFDRLAALDGA
ncbi:MAG: alpha/beta hydrolase family protein [Actinobacteria bacterium]|nr:alpha/beta hydrolase family protein [Actinomycetota bacterium]